MTLNIGIGDAFNFIGSAASIASFIQQNSGRLNGQDASYETIVASLRQPKIFLDSSSIDTGFIAGLNTGERRDIAKVAQALLISGDLLDELKRKLDECFGRHLNGIRDAETTGQRDAAHHKARKCVCELLRDIRDFNGGVLPSKYLQRLWQSYGCSS